MKRACRGLNVLSLVAAIGVPLLAQPSVPAARNGLLFGGIGKGSYAPIQDQAAAARWKDVEARAKSVKTKLRPLPKTGGEFEMVIRKRQAYERLLIAVALPLGTHTDREVWVQEEAVSFVEGLRPCYEWEGFSDCPQKEAEFAEFWLKWDPSSSFREFLPIFASHRWTCAAEALEYEKKPAEAAAAHARSKKLIAVGLQSVDPLMRYLARELERDRRCHTRD
jgi:hypothetical protein